MALYICSPTRYTMWSLMSKFYSALKFSSTCFGPHRYIIRSVLYKLYSQALVCGNTRTTRHVQPLQSCMALFLPCVLFLYLFLFVRHVGKIAKSDC